MIKIYSEEERTWCPGCTNFLLMEAARKAIEGLISEKTRAEDVVVVTGIGCHAKIFDYINLSSFYGLHGRVLPTALGIKIGNPNLKVIGFGGDGDTYAEGMEHFVHACRHNSDMTMIVVDNRLFALTTGQASPTTELGFKDRSFTGVIENPLNPTRLALAAGASFVSRINVMDIEKSSEIIGRAMNHKGFSFVEALQPCLKFNDFRERLKNDAYYIKDNGDDMKKAFDLVSEWDYTAQGKIPLGVFYQGKRKTLEESEPQLNALLERKEVWWKKERKIDICKLI